MDELVSEISDPTVMLRPVRTGGVVGTLHFDSTFCMAIRHLSDREEAFGPEFG